MKIYTDAGCLCHPKIRGRLGERVPGNLAVYTGELVVMLLALRWRKNNRLGNTAKYRKYIASGSASALLRTGNMRF